MMNKAILIGRLGKDPELTYTQGGTARCRFSLATSESYKDNQTGERKEKTVWHTIVVCGNQAESVSKYLRKGSKCYIDGKIDNRSYEDNQGVKKYISEIVAHRVGFLDSKGDSEGGGYQGGGGGSQNRGGGGSQEGGGGYGPTDDDIPF